MRFPARPRWEALRPLLILAGVGRGIATLLQATAITDRWGPRAYGHLSAVMGVAVLLATAIAPWAGTFLAWATGSYATGFAVLAGLAAVGTVLLLLSARPHPARQPEATRAEPATA
ncbi:hypothetical protein NQ038_03350 [Brevibacterium sp. 50QC2O2]|uniref:MFS transporter n=1 Tax=Brevibacterium TaxID=1696 RepID=UPI00211B9FB3|nr:MULTISPECIES: MFS transporter [unclassified Brevibacterium]MCQ9368896.1 hypothetical protein [Brevibacterium sp. 91QC2O2]MCQ9386031.1 hypothetical protein [Brevibacterium sp. 68QC2CO]MCQ9387678.1 hypothetical protein [Brevibacterium sp. 50QC2O2]